MSNHRGSPQFIEEAFKLAEAGLYKQTEIVDKLKRKGFNVSKSLLNRILRNPLYTGLIKVQWFPDYIEARHKPIISKDIFFRVQGILDGKRPTMTPKLRNHPDFPLRNFIRCDKCGQKLTGSWSTGRKKVRYPYYHCRTQGCSLSVRKEVLDTKFIKYLESFQPKDDTLVLFEAIVRDIWKTKQKESIKETSLLKKELRQLEEKRLRIEGLIINGSFDVETYKRNSERINEGMMLKRIELSEVQIELNDIESCLRYCRFFLSNCAALWRRAELDLKQRFQKLIFPKEIYYNGETFGTAGVAFIFRHLRQICNKEFCLAPGQDSNQMRDITPL